MSDSAQSPAVSPTEPKTHPEVITTDRFAGKTVIVTGAASGIGKAVASRIAREGGRVIATDVASEKLNAFAKELTTVLPDGAEIIAVPGDISDDADNARIVAAAGPKIDGLANVAAIMDDMSAVHEVTDEMWDRVIRINVGGVMKLSRAVLPHMLEAGTGSIVNVTSEAGLRGSAAGAAYTTSKHAVNGLTKSMAVMYLGTGVRVNAVAPGGVATGIQVPQGATFGPPRIYKFMGNMPGIAQAEQLAATITFLLSDDSSNINGTIIADDGGWSAV